MKKTSSLSLPSFVAALSLVGCAKLTQPPSRDIEPVGSAEATAASAKPDPIEAIKNAKKELDEKLPATPPSDEKLETKDIVVGKGAEAKAGDKVKVHYVGTLTDGKEFDASKKHGQPFEFELGAGRVIKGWDQGVVGMKVGGKRKLVVPPSLGYGPRGFPPVIPPNATLNFEVELLEIAGKGAAPAGSGSAKAAGSAKAGAAPKKDK